MYKHCQNSESTKKTVRQKKKKKKTKTKTEHPHPIIWMSHSIVSI